MADEVYRKLQAVQLALKAPKGQYNNYGGFKYRSCEDILEALKPHLQEQGLVLKLIDEPEIVGERYYIKSTARLFDLDGSNHPIIVTAYAREPISKKGMDESQITGMASSYARKYALSGMFLIDDTKDADALEPDNAKAPDHAPQQPNQPQPPQADIQDRIAQGVVRLASISPLGIDGVRAAISGLNPQAQLDWLIREYNSAKSQLNEQREV